MQECEEENVWAVFDWKIEETFAHLAQLVDVTRSYPQQTADQIHVFPEITASTSAELLLLASLRVN